MKLWFKLFVFYDLSNTLAKIFDLSRNLNIDLAKTIEKFFLEQGKVENRSIRCFNHSDRKRCPAP